MDSPAAQRFVFSVLPAMAGLVALLFVAGSAANAMPGAWGVALSILGCISVGLGVITLRVVGLDSLHLRDLRRRFRAGFESVADGERIAAAGTIRCVPPGEAMASPLTGHRCAAYHYRVSRSRRVASASSSGNSTRFVTLAQGVHFQPCELVTADDARLRVLSLPWMEVDLRADPRPADCEPRLRALFDDLSGAEWAGQPEREGRLLGYRAAVEGPVAEDYGRCDEPPKHVDDMNLQEAWLPVGEPVCLVGQYDRIRGGIGAGTGPLARGLHVIRGNRAEAMGKLVREVRGYGLTGAILLAVGAAMLTIPFVLGGD